MYSIQTDGTRNYYLVKITIELNNFFQKVKDSMAKYILASKISIGKIHRYLSPNQFFFGGGGGGGGSWGREGGSLIVRRGR